MVGEEKAVTRWQAARGKPGSSNAQEDVIENEGNGTTGSGLKKERVSAGKVTDNGDTSLLNMKRVVLQVAELNNSCAAIRHGGVEHMS